MLYPELQQVRTDPVNVPDAGKAGVTATMLRADLLHPVISGNKWYKLRYYLEAAQQQQVQLIVTRGGAWSNHIVATAAACRLHGKPCAGIIRGEAPAVWSATLLEAKAYGMQLHFISREDFRNGHVPDIIRQTPHLMIPEGGHAEAGVRGAATMLDHMDIQPYTHILCAVGTGTMMAGLIRRASPHQQVIGIPVLKTETGMDAHILPFLTKNSAYRFEYGFHFGGYAKRTDELIRFMNQWYVWTGIPTDFVYTGKLCYAFHAMLKQGRFQPGSHVLLIHSGGLQGNASLPSGTLNY